MKKKIYISITMIFLLALCISLCACLTGCGNSSENIKLGYTHDEVRKIMGDPYEDLSSDYTWCYLGSSYTNVLNQIAKNEEAQEEALMKGDLKRLIDLANQEEELQAKLETTVYEYTEITFVRDETKGYIVNSVMFDKNRCNAYPIDKREVKSVEVGGTIVVDEITDKTGNTEKAIVMVNGEVGADAYYKARYTDGSYRLAYLTDVEVVEATANKAKITWSDNLATYETNVDIQIIGTVDKYGALSIDSDIGKKLTSFTIPGNVTSIGNNAFSGCTNLTSITIPSSVTSIGESAFSGCTSLESITLPFVGATLNGSVNTYFGYIFGASSSRNNASYVPASLKEVIITGGSIDSEAFYDCANIESITISGNVTSIGDYAFEYCANLTNVTIGNSVTSIGDGAFDTCRNLESITIPSSVTSIGNNAFYNCTSLENITIPSSVQSIGDGAFRGCDSLNYNQDGNAYYLGNETNPYLVLVKAKSADISTFEINSNTKIISYGAFSGCENLTSISIPGNVTSIGNKAFSGCNSLKSITLPFVGADGNGGTFGYIFGGSSSVPASLKEVIITGGSIDNYAFENCTNLTSVTIEGNVTSIGNNAFKGCASLESCTMGDSVTSIGYGAFENRANLTNVTIGNSVTSIGDRAFSGCTNLESISIPSSVTSIGESAFSYCTRITSVTIGNNITIEGSATSIGDRAFSGCASLESVTIGSSVTSIGSYAFSNCGSLTTINYDGTTSGWQSISKDTWWNLNIGNYTVYCTDGTVSKDGTVTPNA